MFSLLALFWSGMSVHAAPYLSVQDTFAGEDSPFYANGLLANESIDIHIDRPQKNDIVFTEKADDLGNLHASISSVHLHDSGDYLLKINRSEVGNSQITSSFEVFPGTVSAFRSKIEVATPSVRADGTMGAEFSVLLKDAYGNSVPNSETKIISSRNSDVVVATSVSDLEGKVIGKITSNDPGVSVLSALSGDTLVFDKPEVVFYLSDTDSTLPNVGSSGIGQFLKAQLYSESFEEIAYFSLEDIPNTVKVGEVTSVTVVAKDEKGDVVKSYLGTIRFSTSDPKATRPADYTYDMEDQGIHPFALALIFLTPGTHNLTVHDLKDFRISGTRQIKVVEEDGSVYVPAEKGITFVTPEPGIYNTSRLTLTGRASGLETVKIVDGPTVLIEEMPVSKDTGEFIFQTPTLAEGMHKFQAMSMDSQTKSEELEIRIDRTPPSVMAVEVIPDEEMDPGQIFKVRITSNEAIATAFCDFNQEAWEFSAAGEAFERDLTAPMECGDYPLGCTISDPVGNEFSQPDAAIIRVCKTNVSPTAVMNLSAKPEDKKVTLFWSPATDDKEVVQYKIKFGTSEDDRNQENITPDNRTQWYVDNLINETKYYFQVIAIDNDGLESVPSRTVEATPTGGMHEAPPKLEKSGGGGDLYFIGLIAVSILAGGMLFMVRRAG